MKNALVISGGGSKGAFAGGIAQYLIEEQKRTYDAFYGTSTGSLLISHLAANEIEAIRRAFTQVNQKSIFSNNPFIIQKKGKISKIKINHFNVLKNFFRGKKTFGESKNLRKLLENHISEALYERIKVSDKEVIVSVSNFTENRTEFKPINDFSYSDFLDWIWISCNYVPFMSLVIKNRHEYADGGFGCLIAIEEAIKKGATHIDAIMLDTEVKQLNRMRSRNAFDIVLTTLDYMGDQITKDNIKVGKLLAKQHGVTLNIIYTPRVLTTNSLVFDKDKMKGWWEEGFLHAKSIFPLNSPT